MAEITNFRGEVDANLTDEDPERGAEIVIARVGERVRRARERMGIPRRVLSENSGVSPRYLAQLEAGAGNISIGLLQRVAKALDHRIEWLVGEDDPWTSEAFQVAQMYRGATADVQGAVRNLLNPNTDQSRRARRICLIGLRGAGKSTLGRRASTALDVPFLELNREIEDHSGMPVDEVMALYGHEGYRELESQAVRRVIEAHDMLILAVAGGVVADPETYAMLLTNFHTIWIRTSPEEHMRRVREQGDERPMAGNSEAMEQLRAILKSREPLYEKAQAVIDTSQRNVATSLKDLLAVIEDRRFLA